MAIRDAEAFEASHAGSLQGSHAKSLQHFKEQAIEEEDKSQITFLSACQTALWASPAEIHGMLVASYQVLMGQVLTSLLFSLSQGASSSEQVPTPWLLPLLHLSLYPGLSSDIPLQIWWKSCLPVGPHPRQTWQDPLGPNGERCCPYTRL